MICLFVFENNNFITILHYFYFPCSSVNSTGSPIKICHLPSLLPLTNTHLLIHQLLKLYKKWKTGSFGEKMQAVLMAYEEQVTLILFYLMYYNEVECEQRFLTSPYAFLVFLVQQDKNNISAARTAALAGLPLYLKEDPLDVFKICKVFLCSLFSIKLTFQRLRFRLYTFLKCA